MPKPGKPSELDGTISKRVSKLLPVRKRRKGDYLTLTGKFPSSYSKFPLPYTGPREKDFLVTLEFDQTVVTAMTHPETIEYVLRGRKRKYTPDTFVRYSTASRRKPELVEVKVRSDLKRSMFKYKERFRAASALCKTRGWRFRIVTDRHMPYPRLRNLMFLFGYREYEVDEALVSEINFLLSTKDNQTVANLASTLETRGLDPGDVIVQVWRLVAMQQLSVDLDKTLSMDTMITAKTWTLKA